MLLIKIKNRLLKRFFSSVRWARYLGVTIGDHTMCKKDHWNSAEPYLITVGDYCQLTDCKIFTHGGCQVLRDNKPDFDVFGKVKIGDWCYIGTDALIMPGVTIEDHCLIAAGSVVTKSIPKGSIVAGNPARIIGSIEEYDQRNKDYDVKTKGMSDKEKKDFLLNQPEETFIKKSFLSKRQI